MTPAAGRVPRIGARLRRGLWRTVLRLTGGLRVEGEVPSGPCVVVANHSSHADTAALLAALPASARPMAAAAADYWFGAPLRRLAARTLIGVFPVRRDGGGSDDLLAAARLVRAGHTVIVFPEGTRSRDGGVGRFRSGAARLAAGAGVPLIPAAISGTRALLPVGGTPRRSEVTVRFRPPAEDIGVCRERITAALARSAATPGAPRGAERGTPTPSRARARA